MKLYIKQKIFSLTDKYNIYDELENPVFLVRREFLSFGAKFHVCDTNENELYFISQKLMTFLAEYHIFKGEIQCARLKKQLSFLKPKINVESEFGNFEIVGNAFSMNFEILCNGQYVGSLTKKWLSWGDSYELDIANSDDPAFFCCLVIAIDNCLHNESNNI